VLFFKRAMGFWDSIKNWVSGAYNKVKDFASSVWNKVKPFVGAIPLIGNKIVGGVESVGKAIDSGAQGIGNLASGNITGAIGNARDAYNAGKEGVATLTALRKGGMVMCPTCMKKGCSCGMKKGGMGSAHMPKRHRNTFQK
jgi:phage-related protein